ncbi:uncharacterized protein KRP23_1747 [Phytophthora ramorum]|uniref:DNA repair protein XRCC4 n=1 Tax=Phytophthora ramorum TaxID=164328 RepID=H3GF74_PHYRM|nr:hypothetical protein KRP23_1747 [Phytophthora ramorum]
MSLSEVAAVDADASASSSLSLFVLCSRVSSSKRQNEVLQLQLLDASTLLETQVAPSHKPRALDCSGVEYVAAIETALSPLAKDEAPRFELRWSRDTRTLTLMERAGFAMKFSSIIFQRSDDEDKWRELLHLVAQQQRENGEKLRDTEGKVAQLETLLKQKEALLDTTLTHKQKTEDTLFEGFCAVLNAKKDEIKRLQNEVERAQEVAAYDMQSDAKRKVPARKRARKKPGAKLKKVEKEDEDEDMSDGSSKESDDESTVTEGEDDNESERKRTKKDAISAYSQVPALRSSSVQISSAEDLLSSMDDIIKNEAEADEAVQRGSSSQDVKSEPVVSAGSSRTKRAATVKKKVSPPPKPTPEPVKPPRSIPQVDEPMDSEEEDILDMLS